MKGKVYTRTGDAGQTSLVSGNRVSKDDVRVEAYGTVDELNSNIGVLMHSTKLDDQEIIALLRKAQNKLFNIGAYLANDAKDATLYGLTQDDVTALEQMMDHHHAPCRAPRCHAGPHRYSRCSGAGISEPIKRFLLRFRQI